MSSSASSVTSVTPVQRAFDLGLATGRPMFSFNAAMGLLDRDEKDVENLIEFGLLQFAFDISSPSADKKEIRILTESLRAYRRGDHLNKPTGLESRDSEIPSLDSVLNSLWKHKRPKLRGSEVYRALNCSSKHFLDLGREGCFGQDIELATKTASGQKISPFVSRAAVIDFLKSRRLPLYRPKLRREPKISRSTLP